MWTSSGDLPRFWLTDEKAIFFFVDNPHRILQAGFRKLSFQDEKLIVAAEPFYQTESDHYYVVTNDEKSGFPLYTLKKSIRYQEAQLGLDPYIVNEVTILNWIQPDLPQKNRDWNISLLFHVFYCPDIVQILGLNQSICQLQTYLDPNESLAFWLKYRFNQYDLLLIVKQLLSFLVWLQSKKIEHQGLTTQNVFFRNKQVVISGWNKARILSTDSKPIDNLGWLPLESFKNHIDSAMLATLLYELLTQQVPPFISFFQNHIPNLNLNLDEDNMEKWKTISQRSGITFYMLLVMVYQECQPRSTSQKMIAALLRQQLSDTELEFKSQDPFPDLDNKLNPNYFSFATLIRKLSQGQDITAEILLLEEQIRQSQTFSSSVIIRTVSEVGTKLAVWEQEQVLKEWDQRKQILEIKFQLEQCRTLLNQLEKNNQFRFHSKVESENLIAKFPLQLRALSDSSSLICETLTILQQVSKLKIQPEERIDFENKMSINRLQLLLLGATLLALKINGKMYSEQDWQTWIKKSVLGFLKFVQEPRQLRRQICEMELFIWQETQFQLKNEVGNSVCPFEIVNQLYLAQNQNLEREAIEFWKQPFVIVDLNVLASPSYHSYDAFTEEEIDEHVQFVKKNYPYLIEFLQLVQIRFQNRLYWVSESDPIFAVQDLLPNDGTTSFPDLEQKPIPLSFRILPGTIRSSLNWVTQILSFSNSENKKIPATKRKPKIYEAKQTQFSGWDYWSRFLNKIELSSQNILAFNLRPYIAMIQNRDVRRSEAIADTLLWWSLMHGLGSSHDLDIMQPLFTVNPENQAMIWNPQTYQDADFEPNFDNQLPQSLSLAHQLITKYLSEGKNYYFGFQTTSQKESSTTIFTQLLSSEWSSLALIAQPWIPHLYLLNFLFKNQSALFLSAKNNVTEWNMFPGLKVYVLPSSWSRENVFELRLQQELDPRNQKENIAQLKKRCQLLT